MVISVFQRRQSQLSRNAHAIPRSRIRNSGTTSSSHSSIRLTPVSPQHVTARTASRESNRPLSRSRKLCRGSLRTSESSLSSPTSPKLSRGSSDWNDHLRTVARISNAGLVRHETISSGVKQRLQSNRGGAAQPTLCHCQLAVPRISVKQTPLHVSLF